jgi:signal transduction histidine kinase/DNA-binding NarL/FixJ family response regulator
MNLADQALPIGAAAVLAGGGELGALMRSFDWSTTPLGPVERWPQALRTCVRIMLTSRQPMWLGWGEELTFLYNDAYRSIVGGKHPQALGAPTAVVWREIWADIAPRIRSALGGEEGTYDEALLLIMERHGYPEETYYTFSYSPIPDDNGLVAGIFCANTDDTRRVIGERQLALLRDLAAETAEARTIGAAGILSMRCLERNPRDLPFAMLYFVDPDGQQATLCATSNIMPDHPAAPAVLPLDGTACWPVAAVLADGAARLSPDLGLLCTSLPMGAWNRPPTQALSLPVTPSSQTGTIGVLIVGLNPYRRLDDDYRGFLELVAGQVATAISGARAYEEERRRAEALAELDRAKTVFFSNVSHEFRTPLTLALGPVEEVLSGAGELLPVADRERLEIAHRNHLRLLKLVNTLLDFARIEAGRAQASYEPTNLAALTADLASVFRSAAERAGLRLIIDCPPLAEPIHVDHDMWEKIVLNLLSNAIKYTFEGEIEVSLRLIEGRAVLAVRDTGTGIPPEEIPHLFERFHRVRGARARTHEGTGIGLALVQELVRLHGGTIGVASTPGVGTTFTVSLPAGTAHLPAERLVSSRTTQGGPWGSALYVEEALRWLPDNADDGQAMPGYSAAAPESDFPAPHQAVRILLVDDNADMRAYVTRLLGARYLVEAVADGATALEVARARPPDLVLADVMMPGLDGFELLRALRSNPRTATLPVILLSARAGEEARVEGLEAGADDYLVKPFSARDLIASVGAHLALDSARTVVTRLHHLTVALSAAMTFDDVADAVIRHGLEALGAMRGAIWLLAADGSTLTTIRASGYTAALLAPWREFPAEAPVPIADAVRAREPLIFESLEERNVQYAHLPLPESAVGGALIALPLVFGDRAVGGLGLVFATARHFDAQERAALRTLGELCAQALERARLYEAERLARAEAEAGHRRLGEIFEQAPAMIAVLRGPEHVFEVANVLYQQSVGRTGADLIGRPIRQAFPELAGQGSYELLDQVYHSGVPYVGTEVLIRLLGAGTGDRADRFFTFIYQPLRDADGTVEGIVVLAVDVTGQVQARQRTEDLALQLRAERDRLQQVVDVIPEAILIADATPTFVVANQAAREILGMEVVGQPVPVAPADANAQFGTRQLDGTPYPSQDLPLERAVLRGDVVRGDQFLIRNAIDGRDVPVLANAAPLHDSTGAIIGGVVVFQDITTIRALERMREEFLSSAAHDLKTPLTSIRAQAQLAERRLARLDRAATEPVRGLLGGILQGTAAMLGLINELLDVARMEMGAGIDLQRTPTDLVTLVRESITAQRTASRRVFHLDAAVPELRADVDAARLTRVVGNLLSNAVKYSPEERAISVRVALEAGPEGPAALIAVRDEGIGIPAADLPHIFDRFHRARNVIGHIQGTGIGLASVRGIVEQHGGTIDVASVEGMGSTFTVRLPLEAP